MGKTVLCGRTAACALLLAAGLASPATADPIVISGSPLGGLFALGGGGTSSSGIAIGNAAGATGTSAVGLGAAALANVANATAIGAGSTVGGVAGTALGNNAAASALNATALGAGAAVTGASGTALGNNATASALNALALGSGTIAAQANSVAIGTGAVANRAGQIALGNGANTYTLTGIGSVGSVNALSGPTSVVISDLSGNLATTNVDLSNIGNNAVRIGAVDNRVTTLDNRVTTLDNRVTGIDNRVTNVEGRTSNLEYATAAIANDVNKLKGEVRKGFEGTAIALAVGGVALPEHKRFAVSGGFGTFRGENAFGASAAVRMTEFVSLSGGIGAGLSRGGIGGRGAMTLAW